MKTEILNAFMDTWFLASLMNKNINKNKKNTINLIEPKLLNCIVLKKKQY